MALAFVQQSAEAYGLEVSSFAPSLTGVTAGNLLVCVVSYVPSGSADVAVPTPSGGWSVATAPTTGDGSTYDAHAAIFYKQNASAGTHTATFSLPAGSYIGGQIIEFSGASTTAALDVVAFNDATGSSGGSVTTATSTVADAVVVVNVCVIAENPSTPPTTGYTAIGQDPGDNITYSSARKILSATGTQSATWTWSGGGYSGHYVAVAAVFKADSGGGPTTTTATAAAGAATASAAGASSAKASASSSTGTATVSAAGRSTAATVATAVAGSATVSAVGSALLKANATAAAGLATVSSSARSTATATGSAPGVASVSGAASSVAAATITPAAGSATVSAVGSSSSSGQASAIPAAGLATVSATGSSISRTSAVPAAGVCAVSAVAAGLAPSVQTSAQATAPVLGSGEARLVFFPSQASIDAKARREINEKWIAQERALTRKLKGRGKRKKQPQSPEPDLSFAEVPPPVLEVVEVAAQREQQERRRNAEKRAVELALQAFFY